MFENIAPPEEEKQIDFTLAKNGTSLWCETHSDRVKITAAFNRFKKATGSRLSATSRKVDESDPRGPGFRVYFTEDRKPLKPSVLAKLPTFKTLNDQQISRLHYTGIFTDEDIIEAMKSADVWPTTITEANQFWPMLLRDGATPMQVAYCREQGLPTLKERQDRRMAQFQQETAEARRQEVKPLEQHDRDGFPPYNSLSDEQKRQMRREGRVENEQEYIMAMRSVHPAQNNTQALEAVTRGYSPFAAWKIQTGSAAYNDAQARGATPGNDDEGDEE